MSREAMKLALEALEDVQYYGWGQTERDYDARTAAITALREALAEQPAPVQQEPVAWMHTMDNTEGHKANKPYVLFTKSKRNPFGVAGRDYSKSYPVTKQPLYTTPPPRPTCEALARTVMMDQTAHDTPPAQRTWVGLTPEELDEMFSKTLKGKKLVNWVARAIEAKLRSKNNG